MKLRLATILTLALTLPATPAGAAAPAGVSVVGCTPWQEQDGGTVAYRARMRSVPGTARMALRITLLEKVDGGRWRRLEADGLDTWRRSRAGVELFRHEQQVRGLRQGAVYRARVRFVWIGPAGERVRRMTRVSRPCRQPGGPANLRIARLGTRPGAVEGTADYIVRVVNRGGTDAQAVGVQLRVDGEVVDEQELDAVPAGGARTVVFSGPVCLRRFAALADPAGTIAESREDDNVRTRSCV